MGTSPKKKQDTGKGKKANSQTKTASVSKDDGNVTRPMMTEEGSLGAGLEDKEIEHSQAAAPASKQKGKGRGGSGDGVTRRPEHQVIREREQEFCVYLDSNLRIRWEISSPDALPKLSQSAITEAQLISATPAAYLDEAQKKAWMRLLGESIALALTHDSSNAKKAIEAAKTFIASRANEKAKVWYAQGSLIFSLLLSILGLSHFFITDSQSFSVLMAMVFGVTGAQFSVFSRLASLEVDPAAGKAAHYTEAIVRVLMGALAGIITFAAVKSELVFGFIKSENFWLLALMSIVSGASERFVPSFLGKIENSSLEAAETPRDSLNNQKDRQSKI